MYNFSFNKIQHFLGKSADFATVIFLFIIPIKFGLISGMPDAPLFYSDSFLNYLFMTWPMPVFIFLCGFLLFLSLFSGRIFKLFREKHNSNFSNKASVFIPVFLVLLLLLSTITGFADASVKAYAWNETAYCLGLFAFTIHISVTLFYSSKKMRFYYYSALFLSFLWILYVSYEQLFAGFEQMQKYLGKMKDGGVNLPSEFKTRAFQTRVFATFFISNSLAGYLVLVFMPLILFLWECCDRIHPPKVSRLIFIPLFILAGLSVIYFTGSRGAVLSFLLSSFAVFYLMPIRMKYKISVFLFMFLSGFVLFYFVQKVNKGSFMAAVFTRGDYFLSALKMFWEKPFSGEGWGDFLHRYQTVKMLETSEAPRSPHNMILMFASQTGLAGMISSIIFIFLPIVFFVRKFYKKQYKNFSQIPFFYLALFWAWIAWAMHSMLDFDYKVPGIMAIVLFILPQIIKYSLDNSECSNEFYEHNRKKYAFITNAAVFIVICFTFFAAYFIYQRETALFNLQKYTKTFLIKNPLNQTVHSFYDIQNAYKNALRIMPESPFTYSEMASYFLRKNSLQEAEDFAEKALERNPERPSYYYRLYKIKFLLGKHKEAQAYLSEAQKRFPNNKKFIKLNIESFKKY